MQIPTTKRVSMIELFYDLVFAYMIAQATDLIHHLKNGVVNSTTLIIFVFVVIVFINSWMVQSVFTNRYGSSSWTDIIFAFIDMMIVLYMSNVFSDTLNANLKPFFIAAGCLSLTLLLQYLIQFWRTNNHIDRQISKSFAIILLIRTVSLLAAGYLPQRVGIPLAIIGVLVSWIAPSFTGKYTKHHPIIFSHLLERLTLLTIITFGETIVGIAGFFTKSSFRLTSILIFLIVASLFFSYIVEFDHLIDDKRTGETGNLLIYLHYPIIFGLSLVTVALRFIEETDANQTFAITFLYCGISLMYIGLFLANHYNQKKNRIGHLIPTAFTLLTMLGFAVSLIFQSFDVTATITATVTMINSALLIRHSATYA
ncbi:MAG TPA: low temperature requirement protein A [Lactobacillus sp.]|nr:low temperature requirement protein A [Lactobacillus sp.]